MDLEDNLSSGSVVVRGANHENFKVTTLPTLPRYVQKYSSFVTTDPPNSIHTSLCRIFDSKQIDYDTDLNSFIFHAVYTDSSDLRECTFKVNFFSTNADQGK